jgi:Cu-Zn family superoxide dismutase
MINQLLKVSLPIISLNILSSCQTFQEMPTATAIIQAKSGSSIQGSLNFTQTNHLVTVSGTFSGLKPNSAQGIHIHEKGDCSAADATSAGGHYNPSNLPHGSSSESNHHAGDMPNIMSDENGNASYKVTLKDFTLSGEQSIIGRSVIVHRDPDDYKTQPSGNSGPRIGCGIIR